MYPVSHTRVRKELRLDSYSTRVDGNQKSNSVGRCLVRAARTVCRPPAAQHRGTGGQGPIIDSGWYTMFLLRSRRTSRCI